VVLAWACDVSLTLLGQPSAYWQESYSQADEANPLVRPVLQTSPWAFVGLAVVELIVVAVLLRFLPRRFAKGFMLLVVFVHTLAACGWLLRRGGWWWIGCVVLMAVVAEVTSRCWKKPINES
jgi:Na+/H+ antiporter NhaB